MDQAPENMNMGLDGPGQEEEQKETNVQIMSWNKFECEVCKHPYPYWFQLGDRRFQLMDLKLPDEPCNFAYIESVAVERNAELQVAFLYFKNEAQPVLIGRGMDVTWKLQDISVSRVHAQISMKDNKFFLEDMGSKFGTLVKVNDEITIECNERINVQVGRTSLFFELVRIQGRPEPPPENFDIPETGFELFG